MFCLPPHTTHESQSLGTSVFKSLKHNWNCACQSFIQTHPSQAITKYHFSGLLNQAWGKTMTPSTISAGFRKCGVYPFNPDAIDCGISVDNIDEPDKDNNDVMKTSSLGMQEVKLNIQGLPMKRRFVNSGHLKK